jgi:hypothetical protein
MRPVCLLVLKPGSTGHTYLDEKRHALTLNPANVVKLQTARP